MKKLLLVLLFVTYHFSISYSQELEKIPYTVNEADIKKFDYYSGFLGSDDNSFYILRRSEDVTIMYGTMTEFYVDYFNTNFELRNSIYLEGFYGWLHMPRSLDRAEFVHLNPDGKLFLGYTTYDKGNSEFYIGEVDKQTGSIYSKKLIFSGDNIDLRRTISIVESEDKRLLGVHSLVPSKDERFESHLFTASLTRDFELVKSNMVVLPMKSEGTSSNIMGVKSSKQHSDLNFDNNGDFSFVMRVNIKNAVQNSLKDYYYYVFSIQDDQGKYLQTVLGTTDTNFLNDVSLHKVNDNELVCIGRYSLYSNEQYFTVGQAIYTIDKRNFSDPSFKFIPFSESEVAILRPEVGQSIEKAMRKTFSKKDLQSQSVPWLKTISSNLESNGTFTSLSEVKVGYTFGNISEINFDNKNGINSINTIYRDQIGRYYNSQTIHMKFGSKNLIVFQNEKDRIVKLGIIEQNGKSKEFELINMKIEKKFLFPVKYFVIEEKKKMYFIYDEKKSAKIYQFDISGL